MVLASPGGNQRSIIIVSCDNSLWTADVNHKDIAVRPALWVDIQLLPMQ